MQQTPIAIVGLECVFPGAATAGAFWKNIAAGVDAISDVPATRWDPCFYDRAAHGQDRFPCRRGGFVDAYARFDPVKYGIMPVAARQAEPDQLLALEVAAAALADAGLDARHLPRERTGVVIGRGNYTGPSRVRLEQHVRVAEQLVRVLRELMPDVDAALLDRVKRDFQSKVGAASAEGVIGLVPNLTASRIANRLNLLGPAYTVDAACASALVALDHACRALAHGEVDVMISGAVHLCHAEAFWSVFSELGALSKSEQIRPFDERADGLLIGEGVGILVLKRLDDAQRHGDRIYACIHGTGLASDGSSKTMMTPSVEGQLRSLQLAWQGCALDPRDIGLLEAHGTGTPIGDSTELSTLGRFFGKARAAEDRVALGSVKSMIGHAMPAAGAASLIKTALAIHHGVKPPTLHCERPSDRLGDTRFMPVRDASVWDARVRIAGVNAFGFGGINAHAVLASCATSSARVRVSSAPARAIELFVARASSKPELLAAIERAEPGGAGEHSVAVASPTPERMQSARRLVERADDGGGRQGIFYAHGGLLRAGGKLAFLFPGFDTRFEPRVDDVARHFGMTPPRLPDVASLEGKGIAITNLNRFFAAVLARLGIQPDMVAGHSIGEWGALAAAGVVDEAHLERFGDGLQPGELTVADAVFVSAATDVQTAQAVTRDLEQLALSHDNCPHQVVLCGTERACREAEARLRSRGVLCQRLPFGSGLHSRFFEPHARAHRDNIRRFRFSAPRLPVYSAVTTEPFPHDGSAIAALCEAQMLRPVRFRETIERMYADGARVFVQVGTGSLTSFVGDILGKRPHLAIGANVRQRSGLSQLCWLVGALRAHGLELDGLSLDTDAAPRPSRSEGSMQLELGVPLFKLSPAIVSEFAARATDLRPGDGAPRGGRVGAAFEASTAELARAQRSVLRALSRSAPSPKANPEPSPTSHQLVHRVDLARYPEFRDHAFFRQASDWGDVADTGPVVPMTAMVDLMRQVAGETVPRRAVLAAVEDLRALRWFAVAEPIEVPVRITGEAASSITVELGEFAHGRLVFSDRYPAPPEVPRLQGLEPATMAARDLYDDHWMFHGPAYQGIGSLDAIGSAGIEGTIRNGAALGSLLDAAGQLLGYWVMANTDKNRLAMPIGVQRLRYFGPPPNAGERLRCSVHIQSLSDEEVQGDFWLLVGERPYLHAQGWRSRRLESDESLWRVIQWSERSGLSTHPEPGVAFFDDRYRAAVTREYIVGRYLKRSERERYATLPLNDRRGWLARRVAIKDAARSALREAGHAEIFPAEITVDVSETTATWRTVRLGLSIRMHERGATAAVDRGVERARVGSAESLGG